MAIGNMLQHSILAAELLNDYAEPSWKGYTGICLSIHCSTSLHCSCCSCDAQTDERLDAVAAPSYANSDDCNLEPCSKGAQLVQGILAAHVPCPSPAASTAHGSKGRMPCRTVASHICTDSKDRGTKAKMHQEAASTACSVRPAAAAAMQACRKLAPELRWVIAHIHLDSYATYQRYSQHEFKAGCAGQYSSSSSSAKGRQVQEGGDRGESIEQCLQEVLLDDEWMALEEASVVLLDAPEWQMPDAELSKQNCALDCGQASLSGLSRVSKQQCTAKLPANADDPKAIHTCLKGRHTLFTGVGLSSLSSLKALATL